MGGGGGYGFSPNDLNELEDKAKQKLKQADDSSKKNVFISFATEDLNEVNLLRGQTKKEDSDLNFSDYSVKEPFDSENTDYIKRQIKEKIERASVTLIYLSNNTSSSKWVEWEVKESIKQGKGVIAVYKDGSYPKIPDFISDNNIKIVKWNHKEIMDAINKVSQSRGAE